MGLIIFCNFHGCPSPIQGVFVKLQFELEKRHDELISSYGRLINSILASFIHEIKCAPHSTTLTKCLHRLMQGSLACYTMFIRGIMQLAGACSAVQIHWLKPPSVARLRLSS